MSQWNVSYPVSVLTILLLSQHSSRKIDLSPWSTLVVKRHQIDHFVINKEMLHNCMHAGVTSQFLDSDHCVICDQTEFMQRSDEKYQL